MPRLIAFLRAINVGGHTVTMARLRGLFEDLGFDDVETFIASGNVIFTASGASPAGLQRRIERHLQKSLRYEVKTFLRTGEELAAIARHQPFPPAALKAAVALNVAFLDEPLPAAGRRALTALETDIDAFHVNGREVYWLCRRKQSESTFSNARFEKQFKVAATFRSLNTVRRLAAAHAPAEE